MIGKKRPVLAIRKKDGAVVARYASVCEAARLTRIRHEYLQKLCSQKITPKGKLFYRFEDEYNGFDQFKSNFPIICFDENSGTYEWFTTAKDAEKSLHYTEKTIKKCIRLKKKLGGHLVVIYQKNTNAWKELQHA